MSAMFGNPAFSVESLDSSMASLIIFIFTGVATTVLVLSGSEVDTFMALLLVLFLWTLLVRAASGASEAIKASRQTSGTAYVAAGGDPGDDDGWIDSWLIWTELVSKVLILMTFQMAGALILQEWTLAGVTTQETMVLLFLFMIIFFPLFLWIHRTWKAHGQLNRKSLNQHQQMQHQQKQQQQALSPV